jgi:hypothetical protein
MHLERPCGRAAVLLVSLGLRAGCGPAAEPRRDAVPPASAGDACTLAPTGGLLRQTITAPGPSGAGATRTYELYVPRGVTSRSSLPLLVSLHGLGANLTWSCSADELWHDRGVWAFLTTRSAPAAATCP